MGPDLKQTEKSEVTTNVVSTNEKRGIVAQDKEDERMRRSLDVDIDMAECMNYGGFEVIDVECQDSTECSSSFGGTVSGNENGLVVNDDLEVESKLSDAMLCRSLFEGPSLMGKRRLTNHWRKFVHPLLWRCKWLEIKLQELKSQALNYERELAQYGESKQFETEKVNFEGFDASSSAFPSKIQRKEVMKRKKRKQVEDITGVASYMSQHHIFSYYESKKSVVAAYALDDDWGALDDKTINGYDDIGCNDGWPSLQSRDVDNLLEQILQKIEVLRSRMHELKTRMGKVMSENPEKFSSINMLSSVVPCDVLNDYGNHLYPEKGDRNSSQCTTSQHASELDMRDNFMPRSSVSGHEEVAPLPDMIRSMSQRLLEISSENLEGEILIPNQATLELHSFGSAIIQQAEKPLLSIEDLEAVSHVEAPLDNLSLNTSLQSNAQPLFSMSKQPDKKRARGAQNSGLGRWSRRSSG